MADDEVEAWQGDRVAGWLRQAAQLERQLAPVSEALFAAAAVRAGEAVLDVGCGTGSTTTVAARAVGPTGRVVGVDVSAEMLAAAAAAAAGLANVEWLRADVTTWDPPPAAFDVVLSRFGVMFFSDPAAAFTRLASACRPGGRLAVATWQRREGFELFAVPFHAAIEAVRAAGARNDAELAAFIATDDEGPFSLHGAGVLTGLLEGAGWHDVDVVPHRLQLAFGSGLEADELAAFATDFGPVRLLLHGLDPQVVAAARTVILEALARRADADGVPHLSGAINVVTARH